MYTGDKKAWTHAEIKILITLYENMTHLWDVKSANYRNRVKKQVTMQKIAATLGTTCDEIARKLHNLRSQYMQEKKKAKATTWPYFASLKFIDGSVEKLESASGTDASDNSALSSGEPSRVHAEEEEQPRKRRPEDEQQPRKRRPEDEQQPGKRSRTVRDETRVVESEVEENERSYDEEQVFGNYVASELRDLKNPENRRKLRRLINQAIMEISDMEHGDSYSHSRGSSETSHAIFLASNPLSPSEEHMEYTKQEEDVDSNFSYL